MGLYLSGNREIYDDDDDDDITGIA